MNSANPAADHPVCCCHGCRHELPKLRQMVREMADALLADAVPGYVLESIPGYQPLHLIRSEESA